MNLNDRLAAFSKLGRRINSMSSKEFEALLSQVSNTNPWFTEANVKLAFAGVEKMLDEQKMQRWITQGNYHVDPHHPKNVGVVMAGNIPMVGFHDFLCVLLSGHKLCIKKSSQDPVLISFLAALLIEIEPAFQSQLTFIERLNNVDAVIATGSDNSARHFEYYFRDKPKIIRKNRTSCAVLNGHETPADAVALGKDVFSHFGLGCRNVSKLFVPAEYDFIPLLEAWKPYEHVVHHHKYANNYDYQKSIHMINRIPIYDNGFILMTMSTNMVSPISTVYFQHYHDRTELDDLLQSQQNKIQCIVAGKWFKAGIPFGESQMPDVWEYADDVDTLAFLSQL